MKNSNNSKTTIESLERCFEVKEGVLYWRHVDLKHFDTEKSYKIHLAKYAGKKAGTLAGIVNFHGESIKARKVIAYLSA